ncbi:NEDD4-binding protein 2 isoform X2 [Etheostoma cragini]|uniref:NEDD4-binding protein 2 isoform X2 n=1 Tax=Etheostoma cragini TaxID=417921 RepID=UPI00155E3320|nr:NEDD4-binding protein 2 isoform X2 [Etheostoma cragini]
MPRRKKNGQSPARVPGGPPEGGSLGHNTGYLLPEGFDSAMANNFPTSSVKERIVKSMQEMFSHLDPEVIYIVLSECDFKVENAMDSLLELSVAAEGAAPIPSPVSGFERTAAALLSPHHFSESRPDPDSSKPSQLPCSPPSSNILTEEMDLLVDQELETLTAQQGGSQYLSVDTSLSSFPPPPFQQQVLPELLQSSLQPGSRGPSVEQQGLVGSLAERISGASSPPDNVITWEDKTVGVQQLVDFTHLMKETPADKLKPPLDLAASGRPSAFQVYKKQDPIHTISDKAWLKPSKAIVGGARSKVNTLNPEPLGYMPSSWNLQAPVFSPRIHEKQGPVFLTPVAQTPSNWPGQPRHASPWLSQGSVSQAPLKPSATIPKSWALPAAPHSPAHSRLRLVGKVLVLLRGAPGSGKSTLARAFLEHNPGGVILSTDDYFTRNGEYQFDPTALGEAHEWNHKQAKEAFERGVNPIIIDNTNMQSWEMRPYVVQALKHGYKVLFREPDTWWKNKPRELERRSTHNVPVEKIRRMLNGYDRYITVQAIMGSQMPEIKQRVPLENRRSQPVSSETPCPDLVGQPELAEGCMKSRPQLYSSLPDVSSISRISEVGMMEGGTHKSTESLNFHPTGRLAENPVMSDGDDDMDLGELDFELDVGLEMNRPTGDQRIPDCIVESVMSEDHRGDEVPVAFSESIAQRVRRERPSRRSGFDRLEPADLVKDTNQSHSEEKGKEKAKEAERVEMEMYGGNQGMPKTLDFVGDWPCEGSIEQRQVKRRERHKEGSGKEDGGVSQEATKNKTTVQSGPNVAEFQKLLDLIQTGVADVQTCSSRSSSLSLSSGEELETGGRFGESHGSRPNSEEREQDINRVNSSRGELPDCVLDWKAADSCKVRESTIEHYEGLETEASRTTGRNDNVLEIGRDAGFVGLKSTNPTNPLSALTANSLVISKTVEANECHDGAGSHNVEGEVGTEPTVGHTDTEINNCTENGRETKVEADGSHVSEMCQSPVCVGSEEAESSSLSGGSQERKQRQGRRSGKQCKLALTFTQNCPASSPNTLECPNLNRAQSINHIQNSMNTDIEPNFNPDCNTSISLKSKSDLFTMSDSEAHLQHSFPLPLVDTGSPTQTEPQDFAFLWRLNRQDSAVITACSHHSGITVLSGDSSRFVPEFSTAVSAAVASHPSGQRVVPYRVVHEKGTQVEEKELGATQDRLESLRILSCHFKLVSFDTLEDLYDKCYQDLEWTTNLLLDSGERFFRDDDGEKEEEKNVGVGEDEENTSSLCGALGKPVGTRLHPDVLYEHHPEDWPKGDPIGFEEVNQQATFATVRESDESSQNTDMLSFGGAAVPVRKKYHPDITSHLQSSPQPELSLPHAVNEEERWRDTEHKVTSEADLEGEAWGGSLDDGVIIEESRVKIDEEIASMDEVHRLLQAELEEVERDQKQMVEKKTEMRHMEERRISHLNIQSVELKLPTELALQLTELFGPVGVDPGECSIDDHVVQMDLKLAKLLHQKWKETIQEKQRQATLSSHFFQEIPGSESQGSRPGSQDWSQPLNNQHEAHGQMPFMDHWNVSHPHVSLRDIIKEQQALQKNEEKTRQSCADLDRRDGATLMKENQLYSLFPTIDRHFLQDIFRDHNHSLTQTELFLHSLLDQEPAKTVVAPEAHRSNHLRVPSKEREKRQKSLELTVPDYQDTEDPEYEDFRAEASQQKSRQHECFSKAAEAFKQGRKDVASFYAQQGHLHGQRMREANHRAAVQIFKRVNSSLLPSNILDLHGLHVDEALQHLAKVLQDKTTDCEQGLCRPQLSVITGRGNHSQGGVARIRPAVIDYLNNKHYRFTEPKPGLVLVSLK